MVDFNNESTVATPPGEVVKIVVLERREQVIEALENYHLAEASNLETQHKEKILHARIMALWYQLQAMVRRRLDEKEYEVILNSIKSAKSFDDLIDAFDWMNRFIDDMGLTYIDSRARYDRKNIEDANQKKGM